MLSEEILRRVRQIEVTTRRVIDDLVSGNYRSHFKGHGVQFSEHRQYVPGDDVRHIDWKVSARTRDPLVKKYEEERELTVLIMVDVSGSKSFGSAEKIKSEVAAETAGLLAYAANRTGDKVGLLLFANEVEKVLPPKKGRSQVQRIIRELLVFRPKTRGTNLSSALDAASRILKHSGIVFIISDFIDEDYGLELKRLARRHDVVAIQVVDPRERKVPNVGHLLVVDPETGVEHMVDSGSKAFARWLEDAQLAQDTDIRTAMTGGRVEIVSLFSDQDYIDAVVRFFRLRARRKR
jgi:uncharacterized protein (DUF58 family)